MTNISSCRSPRLQSWEYVTIEEGEYLKYLQEEERKEQRAKEVVVRKMIEEVKKVEKKKGYIFWKEQEDVR